MPIRARMTAAEFQLWRAALRIRARRAAFQVAPEAYYVRGVGWCGPGWERAQNAYCESLMGRDRADA